MRLRPIANNESSLDPAQFKCGPADRLAELPAWINAHLGDNLSIDVLAERACICPRHFSRLFKRLFHSTPADFVEILKLKEARCRLVLLRNSVETVAVAVGFKNPDSFRRAFQRRLGMNPATFRKLSARVGRQNGKGPPPNLSRRWKSFATVR